MEIDNAEPKGDNSKVGDPPEDGAEDAPEDGDTNGKIDALSVVYVERCAN